jgi:hypothetical protein
MAAERAEAEEKNERGLASRLAALDREASERRQKAAARFEVESKKLRDADALLRQKALKRTAELIAEAHQRHEDRRDRINVQVEAFRKQMNEKYKWTDQEANAVFEAKSARLRLQHIEQQSLLNGLEKTYRELGGRLAAVAQRHHALGIRPPLDAPFKAKKHESLPRLVLRIEGIRGRLPALEDEPAVRVLRNYPELLLAASLVVAVVASLRSAWSSWFVLGPIAIAIAALAGILFRHLKIRAARKRVGAQYGPICNDLRSAHGMIERCRARLDSSLTRSQGKLVQRLEKAVCAAKQRLDLRLLAADRWRASKLGLAADVYEAQCKKARSADDAGRVTRRRVGQLERRHRKQLLQIDKELRERVKEARSQSESDWDCLAGRWREGISAVSGAIAVIQEAVHRQNLPWEAPGWEAWSPPAGVPSVVRFGDVRIGLDRVPKGRPRDVRLLEGVPEEFVWPALLRFPERANLLVEAPEAGRSAAMQVVQAAVMRLLTSLPPGQARLTIIDPLGLGSDFGAFLQLADYEDLLSPVRTDARQIEQGLDDLSGHMKKIIQSYLRNDHRTISDFNSKAGEVAEPFRLLVIADFPAGFSEQACIRLAQIAAHGPRCGVLTVIAADPSRLIPPGVTLKDLAAHAIRLTWRDGRLVWDDPDFEAFPLFIDPSPPAALAARVFRVIGGASEEARRVEVPFEFVAPAPDRWWTADSRSGVEVALGKVGPNKAQALALGRGMSQHVLIAGRTGSGKSTLLHALIINLALHYGPDELEFYLIDFKKGVEFKMYATYELPHARVIAVESEREFGVSVLHRLDGELKDRGQRFRDAGVQDLKGYRDIEGLPPLPRILLIIDEFHEFFVEEDGLASEAAQLLDRLVRQGRAFGIHVLLGSQTLSGAYTLARSTLGQMAVRIALQCGDTDAHLILSEENRAARLLSRPGEAIYNDANGVAEGNHFFQIAWLPEDRREDYLRRIRDRAQALGWSPPYPTVVFEGNAPASLSKNALLHARIAAPEWPAYPRPALAWLGESVALQSQPAALFRRRAGDNLLIVGQDAVAAAGVMASALLGLAAQYAPTGPLGARFYVLDGAPDDSPLAGVLAHYCEVLPHAVSTGRRRQAAAFLEELLQELDRRVEADAADGPDLFLLIHNLATFRDLRREDENVVAFPQYPSRPAAALAKVLRDGPPVGIHSLIWCDSLGILNRTLDRATRREFGARVAFQMSASDSSQFLDTPVASRLGPHMGFFLDEEQGRLEKFRPYGLPALDWLGRVREQFLLRRLFNTTEAGEPPPPVSETEGDVE